MKGLKKKKKVIAFTSQFNPIKEGNKKEKKRQKARRTKQYRRIVDKKLEGQNSTDVCSMDKKLEGQKYRRIMAVLARSPNAEIAGGLTHLHTWYLLHTTCAIPGNAFALHIFCHQW